MLIRRATAASVFALLAAFVGSYPNAAQQVSDSQQIVGYGGYVSVLPNASRMETTIVLTLKDAPDGHSNQIVFHTQAKSGGVPNSWQGQAHVLSGLALVAVLPDDGSQGLLLEFSDIAPPPSLDGMDFQKFPIYGISRYGEKNPLTQEQVQELSSSGRISGMARE